MSTTDTSGGQPAVGVVTYTRDASGALRGTWTCNGPGYEQATALETAVPQGAVDGWGGVYAVEIFDPAGTRIYAGTLEIKTPPAGAPVYHMAWTSPGEATYLGLGLETGTQLAAAYWLSTPGAEPPGPVGAVEAGVA
jgi:hypothetical protein